MGGKASCWRAADPLCLPPSAPPLRVVIKSETNILQVKAIFC